MFSHVKKNMYYKWTEKRREKCPVGRIKTVETKAKRIIIATEVIDERPTLEVHVSLKNSLFENIPNKIHGIF